MADAGAAEELRETMQTLGRANRVSGVEFRVNRVYWVYRFYWVLGCRV